MVVDDRRRVEPVGAEAPGKQRVNTAGPLLRILHVPLQPAAVSPYSGRREHGHRPAGRFAAGRLPGRRFPTFNRGSRCGAACIRCLPHCLSQPGLRCDGQTQRNERKGTYL
ncbi:hypothetical protein Sm713_26670 [Streptomyces sp. TS71-3]|nr:hypothetical protein Sm713_26670 [Streptomyces sp. TS71-3]